MLGSYIDVFRNRPYRQCKAGVPSANLLTGACCFFKRFSLLGCLVDETQNHIYVKAKYNQYTPLKKPL
jgi:hypothetical protein